METRVSLKRKGVRVRGTASECEEGCQHVGKRCWDVGKEKVRVVVRGVSG